MKQTNSCPKCGHDRVLYLSQVADRTRDGGDFFDSGLSRPPRTSCAMPWRIARIKNPNKADWKSDVATVGLVEAYICKKCGYTEFYTKNPEDIPVDGELILELRGAKERGPYR